MLGSQLRRHLRRMALLLAPHAASLERRFQLHLRRAKFSAPQREALSAITPGAAVMGLTRARGLHQFLEQVQYRGRRLAKLGLTPTAVLAALKTYEDVLEEEVLSQHPEESGNLGWARDQLHFCIVLTLNNAFYQVREAESEAFYELFRVEVESRTLDEMLERLLATLMHYTGADASRLYLLEDENRAWILRANLAARKADYAAVAVPQTPELQRSLFRPRCLDLNRAPGGQLLDAGWNRKHRTCWSIPMQAGTRTRGVLQFAFVREYDWLPREQELLAAAAERCWLAIEKARLIEDLARREEQVRRLAEHMVEVEESERRRISRELHDEAGQSLLCVRLQLEMLEHDLPQGAAGLQRRLVEARDLTEHTILEIRRLIAALSPAILEQMGLAAALRQLVGRFRRLHPAEFRLQIPRRLELPKKMEIIVYRLVQECCNNISKYSSASHVNLSLGTADEHLRMHVEDDGVGFDVEEAFSRRDCFGLSGVRERVALLGGTLAVKSKRRGLDGEAETSGRGRIGLERCGTAIWIELPIPGRSEAPAQVKDRKRRGRNILGGGE